MKRITSLVVLYLLFTLTATAGDQDRFSRADSLRGTLNEFRRCYDVTFYELSLDINIKEKHIGGVCKIFFQVVEDFTQLQIDLYQNMKISKILYHGEPLIFSREHDAVFVQFNEVQKKGRLDHIIVFYDGNPTIAARPPWKGGFVWEEDKNGKPWVTVACEGDGASLWWPNKDHLSDEPDSMLISCKVPSDLQCISNGKLRREITLSKDYKLFEWFVSYPINNYNVTLNIGDYVHFSDFYVNEKDTLDLDYYVISYNLEEARTHFKQVGPMLKCFGHYFGEYPFWNDGFALVETPYWGMEHQGAIAYGNEFRNNEFGFDFIIIHESAHEWWGNSLSCRDHAELWITI